MQLRQPECIQMRLGSVLVKREVREGPVRREDIRLPVLPQRVQLVEMLFDDVWIHGRVSER